MPALTIQNLAPAGVLALGKAAEAGLARWRAAVRRSAAGQGRAKVLCLGDSTTAGFGVGKAAAWPRRLAELLAHRGGRETCFFADANMGSAYDGRMARGAGWTCGTERPLGGGFYRNFSVTAEPLTFTPQLAFDSVDVFLYGEAAVRVAIGPAAPVTRTGAFGSSVGKRTVTCAEVGLARGAWPVSITALDTFGNVGLDCHDAASGISVWNAGVSGWRAADFVLPDYGAAETIDVLAPDLTVLVVGINDWRQPAPTSEEAWKADMQRIIDRAVEAGSDVLMVTPIHTADYAENRAVFGGYIEGLAAANGLPTLDLGDVLGGYAEAAASGDMFDDKHPSAQGHDKIAAALRARIG